MKVIIDGKDLVLADLADFDIKQTLECGQCFNFVRTDAGTDSSFCAYKIIAGGRVLFVSQTIHDKASGYIDGSSSDSLQDYTSRGCDLTLYDTSFEDYEIFWKRYFDIATDYGRIKKEIIKACPELEEVIRENPGIRLLHQEYFETLISFIISQNKQIPQIKAVVRQLSEMAGRKIESEIIKLYKNGLISDDFLKRESNCIDDFSITSYCFPTIEEMNRLSEDDIRACKAGFRAPYIMDAVRRTISGEITEDSFKGLSTDEARQLLMKIKGVGEKVANCVLLFGLGRREAFPVDVWMKRIMEDIYFHNDTPKDVIEAFATDRFGEYAGYAQQYLFIYGKNKLK